MAPPGDPPAGPPLPSSDMNSADAQHPDTAAPRAQTDSGDPARPDDQHPDLPTPRPPQGPSRSEPATPEVASGTEAAAPNGAPTKVLPDQQGAERPAIRRRWPRRGGGAASPEPDGEPEPAKAAEPAQPVRTRPRSGNTVETPALHHSPEAMFARLQTATAHLEPPFAVLDRGAFRANAVALTRRASGTPVRIASKSLRCRTALIEALSLDGFAGVLGYSLPEALWLADNDAFSDVVVGYPTADRAAIEELTNSYRLAERITLMVDSIDQLDLIDEVAQPSRRPEIQVCLDLDASLRLAGGRFHLGVRRSPIHTPSDAAVLARRVALRKGFRITGLMSYEAQIAGVGDAPPGRFLRGLAVRWMQRRSWA